MKNRTPRLLVLAAIVLPPILASLPGLLRPGDTNAKDDWLLFESHHLFARKCWLAWGQAPLHSPYFCGGYPMGANPESPALSPLIALTLLFGERAGMKLLAVFWGIVAAGGAYGLARQTRRCTRPAAALAAMLLGAATWQQAVTASGNPNVLCLAATPAIVWGVLAGGWPLALAIALHAAAMIDGALAWATMTIAAAGLAALFSIRGNGSRVRLGLAPAFRMASLLGVVAALCAYKILPMLDLLGATGSVHHPRQSYHVDAYSPEAVLAYTPTALARSLLTPRHRLFLGWGALALAGLGLVARPRACWRWALLAATAALIVLAHHAPFDLFLILRSLPILRAIDSAVKYFDYFLLIGLVMLAAAGWDALWPRIAIMPRKRWIAAAALALCIGPLLWSSARLNHLVFRSPVQPAMPAAAFHQVQGWRLTYGRQQPRQWSAYENLRRNVGTLDLPAPILIPVAATPKMLVTAAGREVANPLYRGEAVGARIDTLTPTAIWLTRFEGQAVVNLNALRGWRALGAKLMPRAGRLGLVGPQGDLVRLVYEPSAFKLGLALSLAAAALWALAVVAGRVRPRRRRLAFMLPVPRPIVLVPALAALFIIALAVANRVVASPQRAAARAYAAAQQQYDAAKYAPALAAAEAALRALPSHIQARTLRGQCLLQLSRPGEAKRDLEQLVAAHPFECAALNTLGLACAQLGQTGAALRHWRRALRANPLDPDAYINIAHAAATAGSVEVAERMLLQAVVNGFDDLAALENAPAFQPLFEKGQLRRVRVLLGKLRGLAETRHSSGESRHFVP